MGTWAYLMNQITCKLWRSVYCVLVAMPIVIAIRDCLGIIAIYDEDVDLNSDSVIRDYLRGSRRDYNGEITPDLF